MLPWRHHHYASAGYLAATWERTPCGKLLGAPCHRGTETAFIIIKGTNWHRQYALTLVCVCRIMQTDVAEEGAKCCQTSISSASAILPLAFKMMKEFRQERCVQDI